jgi:hypothetical protein
MRLFTNTVAIDHDVEKQLRVFVNDADDAACPQIDLDVGRVYCAASHPTGVAINRTGRARNSRNQARLWRARKAVRKGAVSLRTGRRPCEDSGAHWNKSTEGAFTDLPEHAP